jgi:acyl-CoA thioester hydrolase
MDAPLLLRQNEIEIRVRYQETDGQGRLHHANYINYFEVGRVELLRASGKSYREFEAEGLFLVVSEADCRYFSAAQYDDVLLLRTRTVRAKGARIEHHYELFRDELLLASGRTVVACVDREGRVRRLPDWLRCATENND